MISKVAQEEADVAQTHKGWKTDKLETKIEQIEGLAINKVTQYPTVQGG